MNLTYSRMSQDNTLFAICICLNVSDDIPGLSSMGEACQRVRTHSKVNENILLMEAYAEIIYSGSRKCLMG